MTLCTPVDRQNNDTTAITIAANTVATRINIAIKVTIAERLPRLSCLRCLRRLIAPTSDLGSAGISLTLLPVSNGRTFLKRLCGRENVPPLGN